MCRGLGVKSGLPLTELPPKSVDGVVTRDEKVWEALEDEDPLTVDPALVPIEFRGMIIQMQEDYRKLQPYEEELESCSVWKDFDQESDAKLEEFDQEWIQNESDIHKGSTAALYAKRDLIFDTVYQKHMQEALQDTKKLEEFMALRYVRDQLEAIDAREANMSPALRAALKDEPNPSEPKMTHQVHRLIKDVLDD